MVDELGMFWGPILLTGTTAVGVVHTAAVNWAFRQPKFSATDKMLHMLPLVGETLDMGLNDVFTQHLSETDVFAALDSASTGPVVEGNVGGGTGMQAYQFKGGIGTASRMVTVGKQRFTVGVLAQTNHGARDELRIAGLPVGQEVQDLRPEYRTAPDKKKHSLLIVVATDAPLGADQLKRVAQRAELGVGRTGSYAGNFSGEFVLALSTALRFSSDRERQEPLPASLISTDDATLNALFEATAQATEEALVNQLVASRTMVGQGGSVVYGLPAHRLQQLLRKYNRYVAPPPRKSAAMSACGPDVSAVKKLIQAEIDISTEATRTKDIERYMSGVPKDWQAQEHEEGGRTLTREGLRRDQLEQWSIIEKTISVWRRVDRLEVQGSEATAWTSQRWERLMRQHTGTALDHVVTTQDHEEKWRFVDGKWWGSAVKELGGEVFVNGQPYKD